MEVSIIMPCLNEELTVGICVEKASTWLINNNIKGEILVGNNASTDDSKNIAIKSGAVVVDVEEKGFGAAICHTAKKAKGKYLIIGDADNSYDFSELTPFLEKLRSGYDIVIGNRFQGGIKPGAMPWANRYIGNPVLSFIGKRLFHIPINDHHCGLRAIEAQAFHRLDLKVSNMSFVTELLIKAKKAGCKITEVPTVLHKDGRDRPPHLKPWRDGFLNIRLMLSMYFNK